MGRGRTTGGGGERRIPGWKATAPRQEAAAATKTPMGAYLGTPTILSGRVWELWIWEGAPSTIGGRLNPVAVGCLNIMMLMAATYDAIIY